jgi:tetratricopeptide (TPR) repeat protein
VRNALLCISIALAALAGWLAYGSVERWRARAQAQPTPSAARSAALESVSLRVPIEAPRGALQAEHAAVDDAPENEWIVKNNAAVALLNQDKLEPAIELLEACVAARPEREGFRRNLAEAYARQAHGAAQAGRFSAGAQALARALELAPARDDAAQLRRLQERWSKEALLEATFASEDSYYFELSFDTTRADLLAHREEVRASLEQAYGDLVEFFAFDPLRSSRPGEPFRVKLLDSSQFQDVTGVGDWAGGTFDGTIRVSIDDLLGERDRWQRVLRHELVHAFVREIAGAGVPGWLNEGLSQWLEWRPGEEAERRARVRSARASLRGALLFELSELEPSLASGVPRARMREAYACSLAFVDRLCEVAGQEVLRRMLAEAKRGVAAPAAFAAYAGQELSVCFADFRLELAQ